MGPSARIGIVRGVRARAAAALAQVVRDGEGRSERQIRDRWVRALGACPDLLPEGWYQPPPTGAAVLIGEPPDFGRVEYESLRHERTWARGDVRLGKDSLVYAYASPVHAASGMIGDFGVTVYAGANERIRAHVAACLELTVRIAESARVGMELRELFDLTEDLAGEAGLGNRTTSATDAGAANIGHTIPWSSGECPQADARVLRGGDPAAARELISRRRVFVNASARQRIAPTMAFTVEPRLSSPGLPLCGFHIIVAFQDGRRSVLCDYRDVFGVFNMLEYLPRYVPRRVLEVVGGAAEGG